MQINYLNIIYFIIKQFLKININNDKHNNNNEINNHKYIIQHLPYCIYCKKKIKKPLILGEYVSQCNYCGKMILYLNTKLKNYLINNIKNYKQKIQN